MGLILRLPSLSFLFFSDDATVPPVPALVYCCCYLLHMLCHSMAMSISPIFRARIRCHHGKILVRRVGYINIVTFLDIGLVRNFHHRKQLLTPMLLYSVRICFSFSVPTSLPICAMHKNLAVVLIHCSFSGKFFLIIFWI